MSYSIRRVQNYGFEDISKEMISRIIDEQEAMRLTIEYVLQIHKNKEQLAPVDRVYLYHGSEVRDHLDMADIELALQLSQLSFNLNE